ncbi:MAG: hypothetical protein R3C56_03775 [Pirellulaceae bacterium]
MWSTWDCYKSTPSSKAELGWIAAQIERIAPQAIDVRPTSYFIARTKFLGKPNSDWKDLLIGTIMGLVVGAIICFQIQFTDINEHSPNSPRSKLRWHCLFLECHSVTVVLPGLPGICPWFDRSPRMYWLLVWGSGLVMSMTWDRIRSCGC